MSAYHGILPCLILVLGASCGADLDPASAPHSLECWPGGPLYEEGPVGTAEIGFGDEYIAISDGDTLLVEAGTQGGYHITLRARTGGLLDYGDPQTLDIETNPHTRWTAFYPSDGAVATWPSCPYHRGYEPLPAESQLVTELDHELPVGKLLLFDHGKKDRLFSEPVTLVAEVLDCHGVYARAEATISVGLNVHTRKPTAEPQFPALGE